MGLHGLPLLQVQSVCGIGNGCSPTLAARGRRAESVPLWSGGIPAMESCTEFEHLAFCAIGFDVAEL